MSVNTSSKRYDSEVQIEQTESVPFTIRRPDDMLWRQFKSMATDLGTKEQGVQVCVEEYLWNETVQWRNPSPSVRKLAQSWNCADRWVDVTLHIFDTIVFMVLVHDFEGQKLLMKRSNDSWVKALLVSQIVLAESDDDDSCWSLEDENFRYRFKSRYNHSKETAIAFLQGLTYLRRNNLENQSMT